MSRKSARKRAIIRRRIFLSVVALVLALAIMLIVFLVKNATKKPKKEQENSSSSSNISSSSNGSSNVSSKEESKPKYVTLGEYKLDATYTELLLVNDKNPLPENYKGNLVIIPQKYLKGELNQIDKNVWPYLQAMFDNARKEGIDIGCWSPYRSYATQKWLFQRKIDNLISTGTPESEAEEKAATVVARPGTSEHQTGLALDINSASSSFSKTNAYKWLCENAEDYGFVQRYTAEKQSKTGIIPESWHWRFVGINAAKEMNELGYCLEEYVAYKNK